SELLLNAIKEAIYDGLSPLAEATDGLFAFVVPELDADGNEQYDDSGKLVTRLPDSADDVELILTPEGLIKFNIKFGGTLVDGELPIDLNAGLPGLNINVDAAIKAKIDYLMGIGLGIGNMAAEGALLPRMGVFLDTSGINAAGEEIALDIDATLAQGSTASGTLGFLAMDFDTLGPNGEDIGGTGLHGHLGLDIADGSGDGRWTFGETLKLTLHASAAAEANLYAKVSTVAGDFLPSISTIIHYNQLLGDVQLSTSGGAKFSIGSPDVTLEAVTLDVGSMFGSFLGPVFDTILN